MILYMQRRWFRYRNRKYIQNLYRYHRIVGAYSSWLTSLIKALRNAST